MRINEFFDKDESHDEHHLLDWLDENKAIRHKSWTKEDDVILEQIKKRIKSGQVNE